MRSVLRWLTRVAAGAILLAVVTIAAALVLAHTAWGRAQLRARIEAALRDEFPGGAHVRALEGSLLGTVTLHDIELDGADHTPLATISTLHAELALWPLVTHTARLDRLVADDVRLVVRDEPAGPPAPAGPPTPSPWRIELGRTELHRATVAIEAGGTKQTLVELDAVGAGTIDRGRVALFGSIHGRWQERDAGLAVVAAVEIDGGVRVRAAQVSLGGATISVAQLAIDAGRGAGPPALRALELTASLGDARLWASLQGEPARRTVRGVISATGVDLAAVSRGRLCGRGDVLAALEGGDDHLRGTLLVHGDVLGALGRLDQWSDPVAPDAAPAAPPVRRPCPATEMAQSVLVALDAALAPTSTQASALALARGDGVQAFATATAHRDATGAISLQAAHASATGNVLDVAGQHVTGALRADATAHGALSPGLDVEVTGMAAGDTVALGDTAIATIRGPFALRIDRSGRSAEAHLTARGVRSGTTEVGAIRTDISTRFDGRYRVAATAWTPSGLEIFADAVVAARHARPDTEPEAGSDSVIEATVQRSRIRLPIGATWTGRDGDVVVNRGRIALRGATLRAGDARIALRGTLARPTGALDILVEADRLAASAIDARYRGFARATLALARRGGSWSGDATLALSGFAVADGNELVASEIAPGESTAGESTAGAPTIDATAHATLGGRRATLEVRAGEPDHGVELAFAATAPRDPFDLGAWQRLDRSAIRGATLTAHQVALAQLGRLAGVRAPLTGTIDGSVNLAPGDLHGGFTLRGVELPFATAGGELTVAPAGPAGDDLGVHLAAPLPDIARLVAQARLAVPQRPFDPASWQHGGRDLVRDASARLDQLALDDAPERRRFMRWLADHGIAVPVHARASVALTLGAAARDASLAIDLDASGGPLVAPVATRIDITASARGTHARTTLRAGPEGVVDLGALDGDTPVTLDRWLTRPASALQFPVVAQWTLSAAPAVPLLTLLGRREITAGTLEGHGAIRGTLATPIVDAHLVARDIAVAPGLAGRAPPVFRELGVDAAWGGASGHIEINGTQVGGGAVHAVASGRPDQLAAVTGSITTRQLDIASITAILSSAAPGSPSALGSAAGIVDADLALRAGARITGTATIKRGTLPIAAVIGTVSDATANIAIDERSVTAKLDGKLGGGKVSLDARSSGDLSELTATLRLERVSPIVALRPIVTATLRAKLRLGEARCRDDNARVCGEVTVEPDARVVLPEQPETPLLDPDLPSDLILVDTSRAGRAPAASAEPRPPGRPWLVARVELPQVAVEASDVAEGNGFQGMLRSDQLVVSLGDATGVRGEVAIDNADADILGRHYQVDPSTLTFDGTTDPLLDLHLSHGFPELTLLVAVSGRASNPKPRFASDAPGYTSDQLFGFFLGGEPGGDPGNQTREAVAGGLARSISGRLGRRIGKELPIQLDTVSCEPATSATTATGGSCTFGKWISRRLYLTYRQHLGTAAPDENTGDVQFQYRVGRKTVIEGSGGDRGHYGADLLWRHRW